MLCVLGNPHSSHSSTLPVFPTECAGGSSFFFGASFCRLVCSQCCSCLFEGQIGHLTSSCGSEYPAGAAAQCQSTCPAVGATAIYYWVCSKSFIIFAYIVEGQNSLSLSPLHVDFGVLDCFQPTMLLSHMLITCLGVSMSPSFHNIWML